MATQTTKMIDVTRTYVPVDPNAFPENLSGVSREDSPEAHKEIVAFEGYNFLPTSYGYKSFFGINSLLDVDAIPSRVDDFFVLQTDQFVNLGVALCEDGIWTKEGNEVGTWTHAISLTIPADGIHYNWTRCIIGNELFCYRSGEAAYYKYSNSETDVSQGEIDANPSIDTTPHPANVFFAVVPNFLNMEGQLGIFKAGGRLGFWDSEDSTAWSNIDDFADFVPAVLTLANGTIFQEITGRIVNILAYGDGFVIYATKSIILIQRNDSATSLWNPKVLLKNAGIAFQRQCCSGANDTLQFAYTNIGLYKIENGDAKVIVTEVTDFLKESSQPVFLTILEGRYLFLEVLDGNYIDGLVQFTTETVPAVDYTYPSNYYQGTAEGQQEAIEADRLAGDYPVKTNPAENFTPVWEGFLHDVNIVRPLSVGLPTISAYTYDQGDLPHNTPGSYTGRITLGRIAGTDIDHMRYNTGIQVQDNTTTPPGGVPNCQYQALVESDKEREYFSIVPTISAGTDDSRAFTEMELEGAPDPLIALQIATWEANNQELIDVISYLGGIRQEKTVAYDMVSTVNPSLSFINVLNSVSGSPSGNQSSFTNYAYNYDFEDITTSYASYPTRWESPTVYIENGNLRLRRRQIESTTVAYSIRFSKEDVSPNNYKFYEQTYNAGPNNCAPVTKTEDLTYSLLKATGDIFAVSVPVTAGEGVEQIMQVDLAGYSYNGGTDFIPVGDITYFPDTLPVTIPPSSFLLQDGSTGPVYPTIPGALVFDLELKKWGKMKQDYIRLIEWSPINSLAGDNIPYSVFGIQGGIVKPDGRIALFDKYPIDSYIKYGKIGYWRQGMTSAQEIRMTFRTPSNVTITVESSLDGSLVEPYLTKTDSFLSVSSLVMCPSTTARWHTVKVSGTYDIKHLEFRGMNAGNR